MTIKELQSYWGINFDLRRKPKEGILLDVVDEKNPYAPKISAYRIHEGETSYIGRVYASRLLKVLDLELIASGGKEDYEPLDLEVFGTKTLKHESGALSDNFDMDLWLECSAEAHVRNLRYAELAAECGIEDVD